MGSAGLGSPSIRTRDQRAKLLRSVVETNGDLQDTLDVAATIESLGWSDQRAEEVFGTPSVFELAEDLYNEYIRSVRHDPLPPRADISWLRLLGLVVADCLHGLTFAMPMAVSVGSMVILHISISSFQYFSVAQATVLGVATFLSFVVTGGFSQAMATTYYLLVGLQEAALVERMLFQVMRWGALMAVLVAVAILLGDSVFPIFPFSLAVFMVIYMVMLSVLWLAYASLYVMRREYMLTLLTLAAVLIAYGVWQGTRSVILAQVIAMAAATVGAAVSWLVVFRRQSRKWQHTGRIVKTRTSQLAYATGTYFIYGILYFVFIFADRLVAWTTSTTFLPYSIWFRGQYELGMDWSLAALILPLAATEAFVGYLMRWLMVAQHRALEHRVEDLAAAMRSVYLRSVGGFLLVAVVGVLLVRLGVSLARPLPLLAAAVPVAGVEPFVFLWSSIAYVFLALSLLNILLMFGLGHPQPALRSLLFAITIDVSVGVIATRVFDDYQYAVVGLIAGVLCLVVLTTTEVIRLLPRIDFMLYRMV